MTGMDLIEFLNARYDEIEATARAAKSGADVWMALATGRYLHESLVRAVTEDETWVVAEVTKEHEGKHIAAHDPAYVLADIAAKRTILARAHTAIDLADQSPVMHAQSLAYQAVLRDLAEPFAGHDDYRDEWRTEGGQHG